MENIEEISAEEINEQYNEDHPVIEIQDEGKKLEKVELEGDEPVSEELKEEEA